MIFQKQQGNGYKREGTPITGVKKKKKLSSSLDIGSVLDDIDVEHVEPTMKAKPVWIRMFLVDCLQYNYMNPSEYIVCINNLVYPVTKEKMVELFRRYGNIVNVQLSNDLTYGVWLNC